MSQKSSVIRDRVILCTCAVLLIASVCAATTPATGLHPDSARVSVTNWLVAGPFPSLPVENASPNGPSRAGYDQDFLTAFGGETVARPSQGTAVAVEGADDVVFTAHSWSTPYLDLTQIFGRLAGVCAYLYCEVESPIERELYLHAGTNDAGKIWVGGELVVEHPGDRGARPSQNAVRVTLPAGKTPILVKVDQAGSDWGAYVEFLTEAVHQRVVKELFPRRLVIATNTDLPASGDTVTARIRNWPDWPEPIYPVVWSIRDQEQTRELSGTGPSTAFVLEDNETRAVRIVARVAIPGEPGAQGGRVILAGGEDAVRDGIRRFRSVQSRISDPLSLTGKARDAYALALYAMEKIERDSILHAAAPAAIQIAGSVALLVEALEYVENGVDPYEGRTGTFEAAYLSEADGTAQPFTLRIPESYSSDNKYSLLVDLHGAGGTHERAGEWWFGDADSTFRQTTIGVSPLGRGRVSGYGGLGECDVFDVIAWIQSHYPVDKNRIYIRGMSMGGYGTWKTAAHYPGVFAAAMADAGWPIFRVLPNLVNLPTYINHGDVDWIVPVAHSRLGVQLMERMGSPVVYSEYPDVNHAVWDRVGPLGYMTRLSSHVRDTEPPRVRISADHPRYASIHWASITRWNDPHRCATLDATIHTSNTISVNMSNVSRARLAPPAKYLNTAERIVWLVNSRRVETEPAQNGCYELIVDGCEVSVVHVDAGNPADGNRSYVQGSYMELYRGEPLLIVYGTASADTGLTNAMRVFAKKASKWLRPGNLMEFGNVPMVADNELTEEQMNRCNLFLIGGPSENAVARRLMEGANGLPIRETATPSGEVLNVFNTETLPLAGRGYWFVQRNPVATNRLLLVCSSQNPEYYSDVFEDGFSGFRALLSINDPGSLLPDLCVEAVGDNGRKQLVRTMHFTHGWVQAPRTGDTPVERPASGDEYIDLVARTYRNAGGAPFAIVDTTSSGHACSYDVETVGWDDFEVLFRNRRVLEFEVTGADLLSFNRAVPHKWWGVYPAPDSTTIDTASLYRVAAFPDILWALGWHHNCNPESVRLVGDDDAFIRAARQVWGVRRGNCTTR